MVHFRTAWPLALMLWWASPAWADANCEKKPEPVENYLRAHPDWTMVTRDFLGPDDQKIWDKHYKGLCPEFAAAALDGRGAPSYGISMWQRRGATISDKLVLLLPAKTGFQERSLDEVSGGPGMVVYRGEPGKYYDYNINKYVSLKYDAIVHEAFETYARTYYLANGTLRDLLTSE